jgi:DNA-binding transcriptional ArsR family regulator
MRHYSANKLQKAAQLLKCMAHPLRLALLCHLAQEAELSAGDLVNKEKKRASQSQVSQYLAILRRLRLVATRREGQLIYYRLASKEVREILRTLYGLYCA